MGFAFKRKEAVAKGIKRLAAERIQAALKALKDCRRRDAVHRVRKDIRKVRAVLRLARAHVPQKSYRSQTKLLRKAADQLAPARDAYVRGTALKNLDRQFQGQLDRDAVRHLRTRLNGALARAEKQFARSQSPRKVKRLLKRISPELDDLHFKAKGWNVIASGVQSSFARGRRAYHLAQAKPMPENLHDWRKRVKDLWHQVCLLRPVSPNRLDPLAVELKSLSEYLGEDHDLFLLQQSLEAETGSQPALFQPAVLNGLIAERRRQLQSAALKTGGQIYAEQPKVFCDRLARSWHAWRKGKPPPAAQ